MRQGVSVEEAEPAFPRPVKQFVPFLLLFWEHLGEAVVGSFAQNGVFDGSLGQARWEISLAGFGGEFEQTLGVVDHPDAARDHAVATDQTLCKRRQNALRFEVRGKIPAER